MLLILCILFFILTFTSAYYSKIPAAKVNFTSSFFILWFIGILHITSIVLLVCAKEITYQFFSIFILALSFILVLSIISFFVYKTYILKKQAISVFSKETLMSTLKDNGIYFLFIIIYSLIIIFTNNHFTDTGYYMDLSSHFKINNSLPEFNNEYRYASSYYVYASFDKIWDNHIPVYYNFLTPFLFFIVLSSYLNEWLNTIHKNNKYLLIVKVLWFIPITILMVFFQPFISSGNLTIQFCMIFLVIICLIINKQKEIPYVLLFCQFFSITGLMLSLIISIGLFIYYFFFKGVKYFLSNSPALTVNFSLLPLCIPILIGTKISYKTSLIFFIILFVLINFIACLIYFFSCKINKQCINNKFINFSLPSKIIYSKWLFITTIIVSIFCSILLLIYFCTSYQQFDSWYEKSMLIVSFCLFLPTLLFLIYWQCYKKQTCTYWYLLIITLMITTCITFLMWVAKFDNSSIWRILTTSYFITFDGCYPLLGVMLVYLALQCLFNTNKCKELIIKCHINIFIDKHMKLISVPITIIWSILLSMILIFTNILPITNKLQFALFSSNVPINLRLLNDSDIQAIKKLDQTNTYVVDNMSTMYLSNIANNITNNLMEYIYGNDVIDNRYWAYSRLNFFDWQQQFLSQFLNINEFVDKFKLNIENVSPYYIILSKHTPYYSQLKNIDNYDLLINSDNLTILYLFKN